MAKVVGLEVGIGITIEQKNVWVKPNILLRVDLGPEDASRERRQEIISGLFDQLEDELDREIQRLDMNVKIVDPEKETQSLDTSVKIVDQEKGV